MPLGKPLSAEHRAKLSRPHTVEWSAHISASLMGHGVAPETRAKIARAIAGKTLGRPKTAESVAKRSGQFHWNWQGGLSKKTRKDSRYRRWKKAIHDRDDSTCQLCGKPNLLGIDRQADHILAWGPFPDLRFVVDNGWTLCESCHITVTSWERDARRLARAA